MEPSVWTSAAEWVRSLGGFVHEALTMDSSRTVRVSSLVASEALLLRLPSSSLLTLSSAERASTSGKHLFATVAKCKGKLFFPADDVALALFLATERAAGARSPYKDYVATLPKDGSHRRLARFWCEKDRRDWLHGSVLAERAEAEQTGMKQDFATLAKEWASARSGLVPPLPSLEEYCEALAMVSSRAFGGLGGDDLDALVPLLDLLDHRRGTGEKKDVTYARTESGDVEVRAAHSIPKDAVVCDTYGAKGNAQLLSCYGFCLLQNIEPDGSSNDVVELALPDDLGTIQLRAGPKAYTYSSFVKAVDLLRQPRRPAAKAAGTKPTHQKGGLKEGDLDSIDAMDNFNLGHTEEEGGEEEEEPESDPVLDEGCSEPRSEPEALEAFKECLGAALARYELRGPELAKTATDSAIPDQQRYAAMLIHSELRTLEFFHYATRLLQSHLTEEPSSGKSKRKKKRARTSIATPECSVQLTAEDTALLDRQAEELVSAYMIIRHGRR